MPFAARRECAAQRGGSATPRPASLVEATLPEQARRLGGWLIPVYMALLVMLSAFVSLLFPPGGLAPAFADTPPRVEAVRLGEHPETTRFVLELSEAPAYRVFTLPDPYRVVIDLPEVEWLPEEEATTTRTGLVEALRFGLFTPGTSRIVLDMRLPAVVDEVLMLPPRDGFGHRLVVDMRSVEAARFAQEDGQRVFSSDAPLPVAAPTPPPTVAARPSDSRPTIVIDAGHGGVDPGAIGVSGTYEKDIALDYALDLRDRLEETGRYRVVLTRDEDVFLQLRDRVRVAEQAGGDMFISLHANTHPSREIRGASVYTLSEEASDAEAAALAAKENRADIIGGIDLGAQSEEVGQILFDLAQRETMNNSKRFANMMVDELGKDVRLLRNTHRFAGFAVLKSPQVPSVLFEIGYMTHPEEERLLLSQNHRRTVNEALIRSINSYFAWQEAHNRP